MTTTNDLMDQCRQRGIALYVAGDELRFRGRRGAMTQELRQALRDRRAETLAALRSRVVAAGPEVPRGARLFFQDDRGRPCRPESAHMWCWSGGPRWFYVAEHAPPGGHPIDGTRW
jgi:hypothetical protein